MITGEIKNRIDAIWDTYWVGGITNPMSVLEQMTYLFFMKMIDDAQQKKEALRTRRDKSFLVPVDEIRQDDYVLSINKYKEVEREKVEYESTEVIQGRIEALESEIAAAISEFRTKFM